MEEVDGVRRISHKLHNKIKNIFYKSVFYIESFSIQINYHVQSHHMEMLKGVILTPLNIFLPIFTSILHQWILYGHVSKVLQLFLHFHMDDILFTN